MKRTGKNFTLWLYALRLIETSLNSIRNQWGARHSGPPGCASGIDIFFCTSGYVYFVTKVLVADKISHVTHLILNRRDGVAVRASASYSVDLGFNPLVESCQKTFKNCIHSFPAWCSAFRGGCGEQAGKFTCCVLGKGT